VHETLAEVRTELLGEKEKNRSLCATLTTRPIPESSGVENLNTSLVLNRELTPRENCVISTSSPETSSHSLENYLTK
ncbi:ankyrin repeat domain-containing protein 18B-like, partial [Daubentonia madagascariensis]